MASGIFKGVSEELKVRKSSPKIWCMVGLSFCRRLHNRIDVQIKVGIFGKARQLHIKFRKL